MIAASSTLELPERRGRQLGFSCPAGSEPCLQGEFPYRNFHRSRAIFHNPGGVRQISSSSPIARRPRPTVSPSNTSAASTNAAMISAVKNSPMPSAANERNGHRQFHRHSAFAQVLVRFMEDRPSAEQDARDTDQADTCGTAPILETRLSPPRSRLSQYG